VVLRIRDAEQQRATVSSADYERGRRLRLRPGAGVLGMARRLGERGELEGILLQREAKIEQRSTVRPKD
jgi:hypothetical protein